MIHVAAKLKDISQRLRRMSCNFESCFPFPLSIWQNKPADWPIAQWNLNKSPCTKHTEPHLFLPAASPRSNHRNRQLLSYLSEKTNRLQMIRDAGSHGNMQQDTFFFPAGYFGQVRIYIRPVCELGIHPANSNMFFFVSLCIMFFLEDVINGRKRNPKQFSYLE